MVSPGYFRYLCEMNRSVIEKLTSIVGTENISTRPEELSCYSYDGTGQIFHPEVVAFPLSALEISAILKIANKYNFPVVPRGAGTGMTGGSLPIHGGLVLVTSRMNRILEIDQDNMIAVVEPGVITGDLQAELKKFGFHTLRTQPVSNSAPSEEMPPNALEVPVLSSTASPRIIFLESKSYCPQAILCRQVSALRKALWDMI